MASRVNTNSGAANSSGPWEPDAEQMAIYAAVCRGEKQRDVAAARGITQQRVSALCKKIDAWLWPQYMDEIRELKARHTQSLMHIFAESMAAWERSKRPGKVRTVKHSTGENGGLDRTRRTEPQVGDPRYLAEARAALDDIRKMWGADKPPVDKPEGAEDERVAGMSREDALRQQAARIHAALAKPQEN